jgi:peptidoglycan/LPS O-acetylase OafA/YrhL
MAFNRTATRQLLSIQVLRAAAALGVICQHISYDFSEKFGVGNFPPMIGLFNIGVDTFFVISGFIMVYSSGSLFAQSDAWREFIVRRVIRIVPLYWLMSLVALAYIIIRQRMSDMLPADVFHKWVVSSFLFIPYPRTNGEMVPLNGVGWTLNYEMFFYLLFAAVLFLQRQAAVLTLFGFFSAIAVFAKVFGPLPEPFQFWCDPLILEFCFGMLVALAFCNGVKLPRWLCVGLVVLGLGLYTAEVYIDVGALPAFLSSRVTIWGIPSALIVAGLALRQPPKQANEPNFIERIFGFLGDASYSLYLVHPFTITMPRLFNFGLSATNVVPPQHPWLYVILQFATAVATGSIVHVCFEKPVTNALRRFTARRKTPVTIAPVQEKI